MVSRTTSNATRSRSVSKTERHDFTQSAVTVGSGVLQVEGGYSYFYKHTPSETESAHTAPELMLRLGLSEDIEFRLRWDHAWVFVDQSEGEEEHVGSEDLRFGLKLQITREDESGLMPTSALEIRGTAPTAGRPFSTKHAEFGLDYIYQWSLGEVATLSGSTGFGTNGLGDLGMLPPDPTVENCTVINQSVALGMELTETNTVYFEWFGLFSDGLVDEYVMSSLNIGIDHYVTDNFVLDLRVGMGLTDDSDDFFTGVGGGYRF